MKKRALALAAAVATTGVVLTAGPANAIPDPIALLHSAGIPTQQLVEFTTPQGGMFYSAKPAEQRWAVTNNKFKRTTTPLGQVATKPFAGGTPMYRLRDGKISSYILTTSPGERDKLTSTGFINEGVVGYVGKSGVADKQIFRLHLDGQPRWRIAITSHKDKILAGEPGWSLDGPVGYLG
ncbi:hypothetical protein ABGB18_33305 [Nonomuraea sp. B12E4]|uniref:hypothetical protein n=1 Tax=Nonomuraea sp. B12E4 TaxID=3153564 RepID=UPI00325DF56B